MTELFPWRNEGEAADAYWDRLQPRERDLLIATTICGLPAYLLHLEPGGKDIVIQDGTPDAHVTRVASCPHYSTDIGDAFYLRLKMGEGWGWSSHDDFTDAGWTSKPDGPPVGYSVWFEKWTTPNGSPLGVARVTSAHDENGVRNAATVTARAAWLAWSQAEGK